MVTIVRRIQFKLARWELPDGTTFTEKVPQEYEGNHFGPDLRKHIIYQTHQNRVPQEKIQQELLDKGIHISTGQIDAILGDATIDFAKEYNEILKVGLTVSDQVNADDTSDRHKGKNGYTTTIGNESFTYLKSSDSKSRINFLEILTMEENPTYTINQNALEYTRKRGLGQVTQTWFESCENKSYTEQEFEEFLNSRTFSASVRRILEEACLYATCIENGLSPDLIILSDDAGQFNVMVHALCWIHAERALKKLVAVDDEEATEIKRIRGLVWDYYAELLDYQKNPSTEKKAYLSEKFDTIFSIPTKGFQLAPALKRFRANKNELLVVLDYPNTPLHNNLAERDIRHTVIKRKISGGTRSGLGRKSRDVFVSLFKTCQKNGISIWSYLSDRIKGTQLIANLGDVIRLRNTAPTRAPSTS